MQPDRSAATASLRERAESLAGMMSVRKLAPDELAAGVDIIFDLLAENERLRGALVALLAAVEDDGLDAAWGDEKFKTIIAAREAVRLAS